MNILFEIFLALEAIICLSGSITILIFESLPVTSIKSEGTFANYRNFGSYEWEIEPNVFL